MGAHLSHAVHPVIGQLESFLNQLEIEIGRYVHKPTEEWICQQCHLGLESEEHYVYHCGVFYQIRGRYPPTT